MAPKRKLEEQIVRVAPLGELRAYTISEHELDSLEKGSVASDLFTIGLCLLSAAVTVVATLLSTTLANHSFTLFFCALLVFGLAGAICLFLGWRMRKSTKALVRRIRGRMPEVPSVQQVSSGTSNHSNPEQQ